jgi:flagellar motor switch protein FliN
MILKFLDCWISVAQTLFAQALMGEPELVESIPKPISGEHFGLTFEVRGMEEVRISVVLDSGLLALPLMGEGTDQRKGWEELLREIAEAAAGECLAKTGKSCRAENFAEAQPHRDVTHALELRTPAGSFAILVHEEALTRTEASTKEDGAAAHYEGIPRSDLREPPVGRSLVPDISPGLDLLLDVELEATLRFGCRELPLSELLELGPGDVVELDRHISDPVDLIVGDKIVAYGEVVLINGNFGLRVTGVSEPRKRLESIRCLF